MEQRADEVAWLLELAVNPGAGDSVRAMMEELTASTTAEPGALSYAWFRSDDGRVVAISERYTDSAAVVTHLTTFGETFAKRFLAALTPTRMTVLGAPSEEAQQALSALNPTYLGYFGGFTARSVSDGPPAQGFATGS